MESFPKDDIPNDVKAILSKITVREVKDGTTTWVYQPLAALKQCKLIKVSFHATYILEFSGPPKQKLILQMLGSQVGDKAIFRRDRPITKESIEKAHQLARLAGIRVPDILASGYTERWGPLECVPWLLFEFIETETVEDENIAPREQLGRVIGDIRKKLEGWPLVGVDTEPIQRFDCVADYIDCLKTLVMEVDAQDLVLALDVLAKEFQSIKPMDPVLIHQDLNDGNTLCSPDADGSGSWHFDALIDWEGVAVADPRLAWSRDEPWCSLRDLANLVRCRWLTGAAAKSKKDGAAKALPIKLVPILTGYLKGALPRCALEELVEEYDEMAEELVGKGRLKKVVALPDWR